MTENPIQIGLSRKKKKTSLAWEQQYVRLDLTSDCLDTGTKMMQRGPILPSSLPSAFFIGLIHSSVLEMIGKLGAPNHHTSCSHLIEKKNSIH